MVQERPLTLAEKVKSDIDRLKVERDEREREWLQTAQRVYDACEEIDARLGISASLQAAHREVKGLHADAKFTKTERPINVGSRAGWSVSVSWGNGQFEFGARILDGKISIISDDHGLGVLDSETITGEQLGEALFRAYRKPRGSDTDYT